MCRPLSNNQFICPICGNTDELLPVGSPFPILTKLEVIGAGNRYQKCSVCGSSDRDRLVYLFLRDHYGLFNNKNSNIKILHVAPEDALANKIMEVSNLQYLPIDSLEQGYRYPQYITKMNLQDLEIENNTIDLIICNHVLQDIKDDIKALSEIKRVLKTDGQALLQVPISHKIKDILEHAGDKDEEYCIHNYGQRFHKRIYSYQGYINRLLSIGFQVDVKYFGETYSSHSLNPIEPIFLVSKIYDTAIKK